jgi:hypothetical protein
VIGSTGRTAGTSCERRKACPSRVAPTYPAVEALCGIMLSLSAFLGIGVWSSAKTTGFGGDSVFRSGAPFWSLSHRQSIGRLFRKLRWTWRDRNATMTGGLLCAPGDQRKSSDNQREPR